MPARMRWMPSYRGWWDLPTPIGIGITAAVSIDTGFGDGCAAVDSGDVMCWGFGPGFDAPTAIEGFHDVARVRFNGGLIAITRDGHVIEALAGPAGTMRT